MIVYVFTRGFVTKICVTKSLHDWNVFPQISRWFPNSTHPYPSSTIIHHNGSLFPFSHFWDLFSRRKQFSWQRKDFSSEIFSGLSLGFNQSPQNIHTYGESGSIVEDLQGRTEMLMCRLSHELPMNSDCWILICSQNHWLPLANTLSLPPEWKNILQRILTIENFLVSSTASPFPSPQYSYIAISSGFLFLLHSLLGWSHLLQQL